MDAFPNKTPDNQASHFYASVLAYTKLEALKSNITLDIFNLKPNSMLWD